MNLNFIYYKQWLILHTRSKRPMIKLCFIQVCFMILVLKDGGSFDMLQVVMFAIGIPYSVSWYFFAIYIVSVNIANDSKSVVFVFKSSKTLRWPFAIGLCICPSSCVVLRTIFPNSNLQNFRTPLSTCSVIFYCLPFFLIVIHFFVCIYNFLLIVLWLQTYYSSSISPFTISIAKFGVICRDQFSPHCSEKYTSETG